MNKEDNQALKYIGFGWFILSNLLIFIFLGYFLGKKFNQQELGIIIGAIISFLVIGYYVFKIIKNMPD